MKKLLACLPACALVAASALTVDAFAQSWPSRPIRLVVTFPPGGTSDLAARLVAPRLSAALGQQVIVDNRPGAGGMVGSEVVVRAPADGHTLLMASVGPQGIAPAMYRKVRYDAVKDFTYVAFVGSNPHVLLTNPSFPPRDLKSLVAFVKQHPKKVDFGAGGPINQLIGEMFNAQAGITLVYVPYKGAALAIGELAGGQIPAAVGPLPGNVDYVRTGRLRGLAVTSAQRSPLAPDLPTFAEQGYPGMVVDNWVGIAGPAKLPKATVERLAAEIEKALANPETARRLGELGVNVAYKNPAAFADYAAAEAKRWREVVIAAGAQVD